MPRYIEVESEIAYIKRVHCEKCNNDNGSKCCYCGTADALMLLEEADDADVVEVKRGEWLVENFQMGNSICLGSSIKCSECGYREDRGPAWNIAWGISNYCPNCGAKMDERRGE